MAFVKGKSGNPTGRPAINKTISELATKESVPAFMRIVALGRLAENPEEVNAKLLGLAHAANEYIVNRACGKPAQAVKIGGDEESPLKISVVVDIKGKGGSST